MGIEQSPERWLSRKPAGLCNGIIISEPNSPFIHRWLDQYQSFDTSQWSELSVQRPWLLARTNPKEVQVLGDRTFFYPLWTESDAKRVQTKDDYDFFSGQYAYHAYESQSWTYLNPLTPQKIREQNTSFKRLVYPLVQEKDDQIQREWEKFHPE